MMAFDHFNIFIQSLCSFLIEVDSCNCKIFMLYLYFQFRPENSITKVQDKPEGFELSY
jgi:hypothetical protein